MRKTVVAKFVSAAAVTAAAVTLAAGPALADPPAGVTPAATDIVGVGSDTTQVVLNRLSADYTGTPKLYSWDATGTSPITTKSGATPITRPNGSSAGISALETTTKSTVDFARSSRGPKTGTDQPTDDFIAYAKDAVSWAAQAAGDAPANLSKADLTGIYNCSITNWNQITDVSGYTGPNATILPYLPQNGSGTRSFFLGVLGITTPGGCVTSGVEENEGTDPALASNDAIVPYSVAHYIGQVYYGHTSGSDAPGTLTIRDADGIAPVDTVNKVINSAFVNSPSVWGRNVYNVVRSGDWNAGDSHAAVLKAIFGSTGFICKNATAQADLKSYGFLPLPLCGVITHP
ncbi:substrate-binding domain-containing protein [Kitasatospora sp. MAP5-34]|uniref:substrate-binding domain-containing protein n=1 Tax=Kitasatospora sp. MAP5-34 TaxID=3035102 RepID=UPI002475D0DC|nr:substrate-binding domain-containing protein [Kitasatospora sp. MAP5-34]MDH6579936.1 ABC-type phosphate transport system substrate-binding protein [Kitasatospora sp. MAP5-34]